MDFVLPGEKYLPSGLILISLFETTQFSLSPSFCNVTSSTQSFIELYSKQLVLEPYKAKAAPTMSLPVILLISPFGQMANIDPIVKLVSTIDEPSNGSKVTMYSPSSHN